MVIMVGEALDDLIRAGKVEPGSKVDWPIPASAAVRAGRRGQTSARWMRCATPAARPLDRLFGQRQRCLRGARAVQAARHRGAGQGRAHKIERIPVASVVASGDYEVGLQQVSEILPVAGAQYVGKIPEAVQKVTTFSAGIPVGAEHPEAGRALIRFLASPEARRYRAQRHRPARAGALRLGRRGAPGLLPCHPSGRLRLVGAGMQLQFPRQPRGQRGGWLRTSMMVPDSHSAPRSGAPMALRPGTMRPPRSNTWPCASPSIPVPAAARRTRPPASSWRTSGRGLAAFSHSRRRCS